MSGNSGQPGGRRRGEGGGRHGAHGGQRGGGVLCLLQLPLEFLADTGLQGGRGQPLLGKAALQEGHTGAEVGQPVHPARDLPATQDLMDRQEECRVEQ